MEEVIIQLVSGCMGSLGFALVFQLRSKMLLPAALGGLLSYGVYLVCANLSEDIFLSSMVSSAFSTFYAEIMARIMKAPATIFFIPAIIPLVPGSTLYYTMSYAVQNNWPLVKQYGFLTIRYALGISAGVSLIYAIFMMCTRFLKGQQENN